MAIFPSLSPAPYKTPVSEIQGYLSSPWLAWFRDLSAVINQASQIDATAAATAAAASATNASASATNSQSYASSSLTSAGNASASSLSAANSAAAASLSASAAAASAASAASQAFSPDYISTTTTVPLHTQMIVFQRVTLANGGRLQIYGRGRIL